MELALRAKGSDFGSGNEVRCRESHSIRSGIDLVRFFRVYFDSRA